MSLHTLLEAVKYVEKEETTSTSAKTSTKAVLSKNTLKSPIENGIHRHWRKRAVAQSVLEIQNTGDSSQPIFGTQANTSSVKRANIEISTSLRPAYVSHFTKDTPEGQSQLCNNSASVSHVLVTPASYSYTGNVDVANSVHPNATTDFCGYRNCRNNADAVGESSKLHMSEASGDFVNLSLCQNTKIGSETSLVLLKESYHQDSGSADNITDESSSEFHKKMNNRFLIRETKLQSTQQSTGVNNDSNCDLKTVKANSDYSTKKLTTTSSSIEKMKNQTCSTVTREAHNLLEKNRRAHLKECFENLKQAVPGLGTKKLSNLTILREALKYVQTLKRKERKLEYEVDVLVREKIAKQEKLQTIRRKLSVNLSPDAIEDILRSRMVEETSSNSNLSSPSNELKENSLPSEANSVETNAIGKSSLSELIDQQHKSNGSLNSYNMKEDRREVNCARPSSSNKDYRPDVLNSFTIDQTSKKQYFCQSKSGESVSYPNPIDCSGQITLVNGAASNINLWPSASTQSQHGLCSNYFSHIESGSCNLSQIPPKFTEGLVFETNISATAHKVRCTKSPIMKIVTSEIPSIVNGGNGSNPMKIVIKPVGNAKHHAQVPKPMLATRSSERTLTSDITKFKTKLPAAKSDHVIFRQRSSVTPPPPSNITSFFPRFSVGCGGSPPLITVLPDEERASTSRKHDSVNSGTELQSSEFREWRRCAHDLDVSMSIKKQSFSLASRKRKSSNSSETNQKQLKDDKYKSSSTSSSISCGMPADSRRENESETNATLKKINFNSRISFQQSSAFRPCISGPMSSTVFPQAINQAKSLTQVCYSTLQQAAKPAIPTTIITSSCRKNQTSKDVFKRDSGNTIQDLKNGHKQNVNSKSLSMKDTMNEKIRFAELSSPSQSLVPSSPEVECPTTSSDISNDIAVSKVLTNLTSINSQKGLPVVQPVNIAQAQIPQFQYVIPMGYMTYPGIIGGAGGASPQLGFSPAMGSFMPMTPLPQGQGWGYVMPHNMMLTPPKQNMSAISTSPNSTLVHLSNSCSNTTSNLVCSSGMPLSSVSPNNNEGPSNRNETEHCTETSDKSHTQEDATPPSQGTQIANSSKQKVTAVNSHTGMTSTRVPVAAPSNVWPNMQKTYQPQFSIINSNFQAANQVILPMNPTGMGAGYILGATPTMLPGAPNVIGQNPTENNIGYGIPMNIMRYPMQLASPSSIQIAAFTNNNLNFSQEFQYGITGVPAVTHSKSSEGNNQGGSTETGARVD